MHCAFTYWTNYLLCFVQYKECGNGVQSILCTGPTQKDLNVEDGKKIKAKKMKTFSWDFAIFNT